jgi:hypothetical protein
MIQVISGDKKPSGVLVYLNKTHKKSIFKKKKKDLNFYPHKTCIFGIQEAGKTHYARVMSEKHFKKPFVFQLNDDDGWDKVKNMKIHKVSREKLLEAASDGKKKPEDILKEEMKAFCKKAHKMAMDAKVDLVIFDEADLFFTSNYHLDFYMQDLVLNHRHFGKGQYEGGGVALWFITRRPQDIPTKIVETSRNLVIFKLEGFNAIQRFKEIHGMLPSLIAGLNRRKHEYVFKELGEKPYISRGL